MNDIKYYMISDIVEIIIHDKHIKRDYTFVKSHLEKKRFWRKEKYVEDHFLYIEYDYESKYKHKLSREKILSEKDNYNNQAYLIENNIVYYRPTIILIFGKKGVSNFIKTFKTLEHCQIWVDNLLVKNNLDTKIIKLK